MKSILDGAMRTAMVLTSRQKLSEATKVIQQVLSQDSWPRSTPWGRKRRRI